MSKSDTLGTLRAEIAELREALLDVIWVVQRIPKDAGSNARLDRAVERIASARRDTERKR